LSPQIAHLQASRGPLGIPIVVLSLAALSIIFATSGSALTTSSPNVRVCVVKNTEDFIGEGRSDHIYARKIKRRSLELTNTGENSFCLGTRNQSMSHKLSHLYRHFRFVKTIIKFFSGVFVIDICRSPRPLCFVGDRVLLLGMVQRRLDLFKYPDAVILDCYFSVYCGLPNLDCYFCCFGVIDCIVEHFGEPGVPDTQGVLWRSPTTGAASFHAASSFTPSAVE
jgi:hypothetical protein